MTRFQVCDTLHTHPKAHLAGREALGLWVLAGSWCAHQRSDGFVPSFVVAMYGTDGLAAKLVEVGLWEPVESGGWRFHDWTDLNHTRQQLEAAQVASRERTRRWRGNGPTPIGDAIGNGVTGGVTDAVSNAVSDGEVQGRAGKSLENLPLPGVPRHETRDERRDRPQVSVGKSPPRPPWCGQCDKTTRQIEGIEGRIERCGACHPLAKR